MLAQKLTPAAGAGFLLPLAAFALLPLVINPEESYLGYFLFLTFIYIAMSQSWNLVGGYAGQASLGQHAFFGVGAYVTAFLWKGDICGFLDPVAILASGLGGAVLAVLIGMPLLSKLKGDYFALGTLGLGEVLRVIFVQGKEVTGGAAGLMLPSSSYESLVPYYYYALGIAFLCCLVIWLLVNSMTGLALVAIREDEHAAAANGIGILKYKVVAFAVGAFFTGMCGSIYGYYVFHIEPTGFFSLNWALLPLVMTVLGGVGTFLGPIIGAVLLAIIVEVANIWLPEIHTFFYGAFIMLVMLFLPNGIMRLGGGKGGGSVLQRIPPFSFLLGKTRPG